jgi:hypothetical protein
MLAESHNTLKRWKNYFHQHLSVLGVRDVTQTEIRGLIKVSKMLVLGHSFSEAKFAIHDFEVYKPPVIHQISSELIQERGRISHSEIHELINSIRNKEEFPE